MSQSDRARESVSEVTSSLWAATGWVRGSRGEARAVPAPSHRVESNRFWGVVIRVLLSAEINVEPLWSSIDQ
jgi:hypothetical protein